MRRRTAIPRALETLAGVCAVLAVSACTPAVVGPAPLAPDAAPNAVPGTTTLSGFGPLRDDDVAAFALTALGPAAVLDDAEKHRAGAAANDAVSAPDGARVGWTSDRRRGHAEAVGARYDKYVWHCHDADRHATYRDIVPCRAQDRMIGEAEYWRLASNTAAAIAPVAGVAPTPTLQPCRTINEVTEFEVGRLTVMREHCLPLPSGP